jgi:hypothetical protein
MRKSVFPAQASIALPAVARTAKRTEVARREFAVVSLASRACALQACIKCLDAMPGEAACYLDGQRFARIQA